MTHDRSVFIDLNARGIAMIVNRIYYDQNTMRHANILTIIYSQMMGICTLDKYNEEKSLYSEGSKIYHYESHPS